MPITSFMMATAGGFDPNALLPWIPFLIGAATLFYKFGKMESKITSKIDSVETGIGGIQKDVDGLKTDMKEFDRRLVDVEHKIRTNN